MIQWLKSLFKMPEPAGPPRTIRTFRASDPTISQASAADQDGWVFETAGNQTFRLFEVPLSGIEQCRVIYRAKLKTEKVQGRAYLEMWCRLPGRGEFFSKGFHHAVKGTNDWATYETPFYLKRGQQPDLVKLNLVIEGGGKVRIKEAELFFIPLK